MPEIVLELRLFLLCSFLSGDVFKIFDNTDEPAICIGKWCCRHNTGNPCPVSPFLVRFVFNPFFSLHYQGKGTVGSKAFWSGENLMAFFPFYFLFGQSGQSQKGPVHPKCIEIVVNHPHAVCRSLKYLVQFRMGKLGNVLRRFDFVEQKLG